MKRGAVVLALVAIVVSGVLPALADVPIGPPYGGAWQIELDFHRDTGHWFAVVRVPAVHYTFITMSTDGGATWTQTDWLLTSPEAPPDIDMVVAGDYVYLAYFHPDSGAANLVRYFASTGQGDNGYGFRTIVDVSPAEVVDVALASDQDGADIEIYYALIASDGTLRFLYDSSADGTTFEEFSPPISNACCGLDMTFNPGSSLDHQVFFSYFDPQDGLHIWRSYPWEQVLNFAFPDANLRSAVAAYGDTVVGCLEEQGASGLSVVSLRSYDAGDVWIIDYVDSSGDDYTGCDVTARGGQGFAITYAHEEGAFDPVYLRRHTGGPADPWGQRVVINETDVAALPVFRTTLNWFPQASYGVAYIEDSMAYSYFDLFEIPMFSDGFESGDTSAWSAISR